MSWTATAFVKDLTSHADGTQLTAREKLILFVLADSHNTDFGYAWIGVESAARASLTSRSRFLELVRRMESRGTIRIERRQGRSNRYYFPLPVRESDPLRKKPRVDPSENRTPPVLQLSDPTRPIATGPTRPIAVGPEPPMNQTEPNRAAREFQERTAVGTSEEIGKKTFGSDLRNDIYAGVYGFEIRKRYDDTSRLTFDEQLLECIEAGTTSLANNRSNLFVRHSLTAGRIEQRASSLLSPQRHELLSITNSSERRFRTTAAVVDAIVCATSQLIENCACETAS